jgi:sarcosine oxidase subunit gamma
MSPDELLVLVAYAAALTTVDALRTALAGEHHMVENVSDARAVFDLKGVHVREVLAKVAPVDMSADALQPGDMRRTRFAQVAAGFWMPDHESVRVVCFRSVADYMFELLSVSAASGSEVGYFTA